MRRSALAVVALCALVSLAPRWNTPAGEAKRIKIAIYEVAPGRHLDFLKWMAAREEIAKTAGLPATQVYAHLDGDRWDYLVLWPILTAEQEQKMDEATAAKGLKTGFPAALEFRELLASHTDTFASGPTSASALLALAK